MISRHKARIAGLTLSTLLLGACASTEQLHTQPPIVYHTANDHTDIAIEVAQQDLKVSDTLRVMTLNMAHARGTGFNQMFQATDTAQSNLNNIARLLKQEAPDVVSLQEVDRQSFWNGNFDHTSFLAEEGNFKQSFTGSHVNSMGLDYGTSLVAKLDLQHPESVTFAPSEPPVASKGFVVSSVKWPGKQCIEVDMVSAHLDFASEETRRVQADEIIARLKQRNRPIILMGDFNTSWRRTTSAIRKLASELGLHLFKPDDRSLITFPKHNRRLDWILVSPDIHFQSYQVVQTAVSDHLGVVSDLSIDRGCGYASLTQQ